MTPTGGAVAQLSRILALIPWLLARPGVDAVTTAQEFGISPEQLRKDLELAFVCGLPGHLPDDLIDVTFDGDEITVSNADTIARPLRLRPDEATTLLVGLRLLRSVPTGNDSAALDRATAKLERAAGDAAEAQSRITVSVESDPELAATVSSAAADGRRVRMRYYVPARDEVTQRDVDPMRVLVVDGRTYLEGWCRLAEDVRLFRMDRMEAVEVLDVPTDIPADARTRDLGEALFRPADDDPRVVVDLAPDARWVADTYPCETAEEVAGGGLRVTLRAGDPAWLVRLLLQLGGTARVVSPSDIADRVAAAARAARQAYDSPM